MRESWKSQDNCVKKEIETEGTYSKKPVERSTCSVRFSNIQVSGLSIEDLRDKLNSEYLESTSDKIIIIGEADSKLDRCVERAVQTMFINEQSLVTITLPRSTDSPDKDVSVKFRITMNGHEIQKPIWEWKIEEKYEIALKYKEMGIELFRSSRFEDAFLRFSKACKILITLEPMEALELEETLRTDITDLRTTLYNNMAGCHLNCDNFEHAITLCDKVLDRDENNVKALYRRAIARGNLKEFEEAATDMERVVTLEPKNSVAKEKLASFRKNINEANQRYDNIVRNMFKV